MNQELLNALIKKHSQLANELSSRPLTANFAGSVRPSPKFVSSATKQKLILKNGRKLLDLSSQTVNCILGQQDEWVRYNVAASLLSAQPAFLSSKLANAYSLLYADRVVKSLGLPDKVVNFRQNNGSDVIELAIISALKSSSKRKLIAFRGSYHGQSLTSFLISDIQRKHSFWQPADNNVIFIDAPPDQDSPHRDVQEKQILENVTKHIKQSFAVIIEPIQVSNNVTTPSVNFFQQLDRICKQAKVPLIFDEVQTGFGWLGEMSAAQLYGVNPELATFSKALTAGHGPLALLLSDRKFDNLVYGTSEKTNGADLRSVAASLAVIDRLVGVDDPSKLPKSLSPKMRKELTTGLLVNFQPLSELVFDELKNLEAKLGDVIQSINGRGLIYGIRLRDIKGRPSHKLAENIKTRALDNGLYVRASMSSLIIKPALTIDKDTLTQGVSILEKTIRQATK